MLHVVVIQDSAQLVLGISTLGKVFSPVRFQSQAVYPGRELSTLTDQWTNQAAKSAPGCVLTAWVYSKPRQVYRLALRMPSLNLPDSQSAQVGNHMKSPLSHLESLRAILPSRAAAPATT